MRKPIDISIIIPVYNVERYLKECLDSIMNQECVSYEVICVNDGSTDGSLDILNAYQKQYPEVVKVHSQFNQGQAAARNAALELAEGEYVVYLDSDDYFQPSTLQRMKQWIDTFPEADVIYTDGAVLPSGKRFATLPDKDVPVMAFEDYCKRYALPVGCVWGSLYKREFLVNNGLKMRSGVYYEDTLFIFQLYLLVGIVKAIHLETPYYYYRVGREGSTTTSLRDKNFVDRHIVFREMYASACGVNKLTLKRLGTISNGFIDHVVEAYQNDKLSVVDKLMSKEDLAIIKQGVQSDYQRKQYRLLCISSRIMAKYTLNELPFILRKCINRFL